MGDYAGQRHSQKVNTKTIRLGCTVSVYSHSLLTKVNDHSEKLLYFSAFLPRGAPQVRHKLGSAGHTKFNSK
uniref:Uncharacterized protein n=1 Tax=Thermococcus sp. CIR10 TaxID=1197731 RepID=L0B8H1_9EURY|nr:hypothetical protein c10-11 [Thermococcus sp. CIR10]